LFLLLSVLIPFIPVKLPLTENLYLTGIKADEVDKTRTYKAFGGKLKKLSVFAVIPYIRLDPCKLPLTVNLLSHRDKGG